MQMIAFKLRQFPLGFVALAFSSFPFRDVLPQSAYFSVPHEFSLHVDRLRKVSTRWGGLVTAQTCPVSSRRGAQEQPIMKPNVRTWVTVMSGCRINIHLHCSCRVFVSYGM